eukprot:m.221552 g.221552  ORF g.221552 m.221552 type:complete len:373 (+) comp33353_c0_seq2:266-1384(+)
MVFDLSNRHNNKTTKQETRPRIATKNHVHKTCFPITTTKERTQLSSKIKMTTQFQNVFPELHTSDQVEDHFNRLALDIKLASSSEVNLTPEALWAMAVDQKVPSSLWEDFIRSELQPMRLPSNMSIDYGLELPMSVSIENWSGGDKLPRHDDPEVNKANNNLPSIDGQIPRAIVLPRCSYCQESVAIGPGLEIHLRVCKHVPQHIKNTLPNNPAASTNNSDDVSPGLYSNGSLYTLATPPQSPASSTNTDDTEGQSEILGEEKDKTCAICYHYYKTFNHGHKAGANPCKFVDEWKKKKTSAASELKEMERKRKNAVRNKRYRDTKNTNARAHTPTSSSRASRANTPTSTSRAEAHATRPRGRPMAGVGASAS